MPSSGSHVMQLLAFVVMLTWADVIQCVQFTDCGNDEVKAIRSVACDDTNCRAPIGGLFEVEVDFVPNVSTEKASISVFASVFGFEMNLPLDDTDACADGRLECPIKSGKHHTLKYRLQIKDDYYPVSGDVGFKLSTPDGSTIACATLAAELYSKSEEHSHQDL